MEKSSTDSRGGLMFTAPSLKLSLSSAPFKRYAVPDSRAPPDAGFMFKPGCTWGARNGKSLENVAIRKRGVFNGLGGQSARTGQK
jgi:hypothetical protein